MRKFAILLIFLTSCKIQTEIRENAIHPEIANKADSVQVANKENAVQIANKENAVHVEKDAFHIEKDAVRVEPGAVGHFEKDAVHVEPGAMSIQGTVQSGAVSLPMTVQTGAVQMPFNIADGAVKFNLELKIEPGAIVVRGVEQGAIQTQIETPWWAYVIMAVLGVGWLITKFRKQTRSREISNFWDIFF